MQRVLLWPALTCCGHNPPAKLFASPVIVFTLRLSPEQNSYVAQVVID